MLKENPDPAGLINNQSATGGPQYDVPSQVMSSQQLEQPKKPKKSKKWWLVALLVIVIGATAYGGYIFGVKTTNKDTSTSQSTSPAAVTKIDKWQAPKSSQRAYPVNDINDDQRLLKIYSFTEQKVITLDKYKLGQGGGSAGKGESEPKASPDLLYTAYISEDKNLWLLSNETKVATQLTKSGNVEYINDWSPNGKKIVYYHGNDTIATRSEGLGPASPKQTFKPIREVGFYLFNIEDGTSTPLSPLEYVLGFIDDNRLLVKDSAQNERTLGVFDIDAFAYDGELIKGEFGFGAGQYDFSSTGDIWAYSRSKNPTSDMSIAFGKFPSTGTEVDSGAWADVQWPRVSSDGTRVAYEKREGELGPGIPKVAVWVYDAMTGSKKRLAEGTPLAWADSNTIIANIRNNRGLLDRLVLVDLNSAKVTEIHRFTQR